MPKRKKSIVMGVKIKSRIRMVAMAGKIEIDIERCKGCYLCVSACPVGIIKVSEIANSKGYFVVESDSAGCTGCALCATMCPDVAITVYRVSKEQGEGNNV